MGTASVLDEHLVEDVIKAYVEWRAECGRLDGCYRRWSDATGVDGALAFASCISALDREDRCAARLGDAVRRLARANPHAPRLRELRVMDAPRLRQLGGMV